MIGPFLTRRMPGNVLRVLAALAGLALAVRLWAGSQDRRASARSR
jgi:uncharacterized membrane protein YfcA